MRHEWTGPAAIERREFRVFGRTLLPLTLGHLWALQLANSPFAASDRSGPPTDIEPSDVLLAVWLCSIPFDDAAARICDAQIIEDWARWGVSWAEGAGDFVAEAAVFQEYLAYYLRAPRRFRKTDGGAPRMKTPWLLFIVSELLRHRQVQSRAEAWKMTCCEAFAHFASICEAQGDESLWGEDAYSADERLQRIRARQEST